MTAATDAALLAVLAAPEDPAALRGLGRSLLEAGRVGEATVPLMAALERAPKDEETVALLGQVGIAVAANPAGVTLPALPGAKALLAVLAHPRLDHQHFAPLALSYSRATPPVKDAFTRPPEQAAAWLAGEGRAALADPVLLATLARVVNPDPYLERLLIALRRRFLLDGVGRVGSAALAALARQCANNEWVWFAAEDEEAALTALGEDLARRVAVHRKVGAELLVWMMYRPLEDLPGFASLGRRTPVADAEARALVEEMARHRREERELAAALPTLGPVTDAVSAAVARQYEENPYPRWLGLTVPSPTPVAGDVLVAGCGTGRQSVMAGLAYGPAARILAVDLSRASLAYAARMTRRFGLSNIRYAQADILGLVDLDQRFDVIECMGVLHHMAEPMAGWRVLAGLLRPGGTMRVGLYSRHARTLVDTGRAMIAARGLDTGAASIRRFRHEVLSAPGPLAALPAASADFFTTSGIRDLLFHVQEHTFTIPDLARCLDELGLEFLGFGLPESIAAKLLAEAGEGDGLMAWDAVERRHPALFRGMYQFTCRKKPGRG